ncbi:MAG: YggS family pyridoxal phosphate-dependent enzyme [Candidatus Izemoplasmatales bacterium]
MMSIASNVAEVRQRLSGQTIVAATKYVGATPMRELYQAGIRDFGENRVKDFLEKKAELSDLEVTWHFIGHLQSNKVKQVINEIDVLHSLDRMSLADEIQKYRQTPLPCFLEVHISDEDSKAGLPISEVRNFALKIANHDKIQVIGLMGMASLSFDEELLRRQFQSLKQLADELERDGFGKMYLSMGMSNDFEIAASVGATHVRLGSILFGNEV